MVTGVRRFGHRRPAIWTPASGDLDSRVRRFGHRRPAIWSPASELFDTGVRGFGHRRPRFRTPATEVHSLPPPRAPRGRLLSHADEPPPRTPIPSDAGATLSLGRSPRRIHRPAADRDGHSRPRWYRSHADPPATAPTTLSGARPPLPPHHGHTRTRPRRTHADHAAPGHPIPRPSSHPFETQGTAFTRGRGRPVHTRTKPSPPPHPPPRPGPPTATIEGQGLPRSHADEAAPFTRGRSEANPTLHLPPAPHHHHSKAKGTPFTRGRDRPVHTRTQTQRRQAALVPGQAVLHPPPLSLPPEPPSTPHPCEAQGFPVIRFKRTNGDAVDAGKTVIPLMPVMPEKR